MECWIVTAVDYGTSCDGKASALGAFKSYEDAKAHVNQDMNDYIDASPIKEDMFNVDFNRMSIKLMTKDHDHNCGCEWNIEKIAI